jgi:hypothetical protein
MGANGAPRWCGLGRNWWAERAHFQLGATRNRRSASASCRSIPDALPDDAAVLQQMLRTLLLEHGELHAENDKLRLLVQRLVRHQFAAARSS